MDLVLRSRRPKEKLVCPACKLRQTSYEAGEEGDSVSECVLLWYVNKCVLLWCVNECVLLWCVNECVLLWCVNGLCATVVCKQVCAGVGDGIFTLIKLHYMHTTYIDTYISAQGSYHIYNKLYYCGIGVVMQCNRYY